MQKIQITCVGQWKQTCGASGLSGQCHAHDSAPRCLASEWTDDVLPLHSTASCFAHMRACRHVDPSGWHTLCPGQPQRPAGCRCCHGDQSECRRPTAPGIHAEEAPSKSEQPGVMMNFCTISSFTSTGSCEENSWWGYFLSGTAESNNCLISWWLIYEQC